MTPYTNGSVALKPTLNISKLETAAADDKLSIKGTLAIPGAPSVNPIANGWRFAVVDATGATAVTRTFPPAPTTP